MLYKQSVCGQSISYKRIQSNSIMKKVPITWVHHPIKFLFIGIISSQITHFFL